MRPRVFFQECGVLFLVLRSFRLRQLLDQGLKNLNLRNDAIYPLIYGARLAIARRIEQRLNQTSESLKFLGLFAMGTAKREQKFPIRSLIRETRKALMQQNSGH